MLWISRKKLGRTHRSLIFQLNSFVKEIGSFGEYAHKDTNQELHRYHNNNRNWYLPFPEGALHLTWDMCNIAGSQCCGYIVISPAVPGPAWMEGMSSLNASRKMRLKGLRVGTAGDKALQKKTSLWQKFECWEQSKQWNNRKIHKYLGWTNLSGKQLGGYLRKANSNSCKWKKRKGVGFIVRK